MMLIIMQLILTFRYSPSYIAADVAYNHVCNFDIFKSYFHTATLRREICDNAIIIIGTVKQQNLQNFQLFKHKNMYKEKFIFKILL